MISVLICTANRAQDLNLTLQSLRVAISTDSSLDYELIVIDNASTDDTPRLLRTYQETFPALRIVTHATKGLSHARHAGLSAATGDLILFTDDDVRFPPHWLSRMTEPIRTSRADAVCGGVTIFPPLVRKWMTPEHCSYLASTDTINPSAPERLVGANMSFHRNVLSKVKGFDVELGAGALGFMEDTLFSRQLQQAGYKIVSAFDVQVEHHPRVDRFSREAWIDRAARQGISQAYVDHHWYHRVVKLPKLRAFKAASRLMLYRFRNRRESESDGVCLQELGLVRNVSYYDRFCSERHRPRHYDLKGLSRKSN